MLTEHSPVEALIQKCTIQCVLRYIAKFLNIIGSGTGNRFSPQTHDDERDKEGAQSKTLNLLNLRFRTILPMPNVCITTRSCFWTSFLTDKTLVSLSKLLIFASVTVLFFHCKSFVYHLLIYEEKLKYCYSPPWGETLVFYKWFIAVSNFFSKSQNIWAGWWLLPGANVLRMMWFFPST